MNFHFWLSVQEFLETCMSIIRASEMTLGRPLLLSNLLNLGFIIHSLPLNFQCNSLPLCLSNTISRMRKLCNVRQARLGVKTTKMSCDFLLVTL